MQGTRTPIEHCTPEGTRTHTGDPHPHSEPDPHPHKGPDPFPAPQSPPARGNTWSPSPRPFPSGPAPSPRNRLRLGGPPAPASMVGLAETGPLGPLGAPRRSSLWCGAVRSRGAGRPEGAGQRRLKWSGVGRAARGWTGSVSPGWVSVAWGSAGVRSGPRGSPSPPSARGSGPAAGWGPVPRVPSPSPPSGPGLSPGLCSPPRGRPHSLPSRRSGAGPGEALASLPGQESGRSPVCVPREGGQGGGHSVQLSVGSPHRDVPGTRGSVLVPGRNNGVGCRAGGGRHP